MANSPNSDEKSPHELSSRRSFITLAGQIVAGASVAAIGLSIANPATAFAKPNGCVQCSGCEVVTCVVNDLCSSGSLGARPFVMTWYQYVGCAPNCGKNGPYQACQSNCNSPC